jgi:large conductance mechanosensitive channel
MLQEFKEFVARGNVIDLAVGVIMGAAFGKIVTTLVEGVLMPPLGLLLGQIDFSSMLYVLDTTKGVIPSSLTEAKAAGVPVIAYGQLINDMIGFVIVAIAVFLLVKQVNRIKRLGDTLLPEKGGTAAMPTTKECPFCASTIVLKATRCPHCTSQL